MQNLFCQNPLGSFSPCILTVITCQGITSNIIKVVCILSSWGPRHANKVVYFKTIKFIPENQRFRKILESWSLTRRQTLLCILEACNQRYFWNLPRSYQSIEKFRETMLDSNNKSNKSKKVAQSKLHEIPSNMGFV